MYRAALLLWMGCVPRLYSETEENPWVAPENTWPMATPPADLIGEGFGVGEVAPDMRLYDQYGDEVSLWQFYGSVIILDISTGWCGPCQQLADEVCAVQQDYGDQGFAYLTVMPQNALGAVPSQDDLVEWATDHNVCAPVLADTETYSSTLVPTGEFPCLALVDAEMRVVEDRLEPAEDTTIRAAIEDLL